MDSILILGATSDIALAIAYQYARNNFKVMMAARNIDKLAEVKNDIEIRHSVPVEVYNFDALDFNHHQQFYDELPDKPDIAVCVFGYLGDQVLGQKNWNEAQKIINTNFTGAASILSVIANDFEKRKNGTIIGISSVAGDRGRLSNYLYGSAKSGFTTFLSGLRNRLFHSNVHVMTVKPGFVDTRMTEGMDLPAPITAKPEQVAKAVYKAYLKKSDSIYVIFIWRWIMLIIKMIPESIFKRLKL